MNIEAKRGIDVPINSAERVLVRIQGRQWRIEADAGGVAVWGGEHSAALNYYGDRPIHGDVWTGKTRHTISIQP